MNASIQLKLKKEVQFQKFDTSSKKQRYIISYKGHHWAVGSYIYNILILINGENSDIAIINKFNLKTNKNITLDEFNIILKKFFISKGLLEGTKAVKNFKNNSNYLWFKIRLIKSNWIKKLKFLSFLFYRNVLYIIFSLSLILNLYILIKNINMDIIANALSIHNESILYVLLILLVSTLFHEIGHMVACMKFNIIPGDIGFAFYFISPVFFSNVNNTWRLNRKQRVLVDLGGIYFQSIAINLSILLGIIFRNNIFVVAAVISTISMLNNFNPFLKMDGYWMISDILGIYNLKKISMEFICSKIYLILGIKITNPIKNIKKKEKFVFIIYSIISNLFIIIFMYSMILLFIKSLSNLSIVSDISHLKSSVYIYTNQIVYLFKQATTIAGKIITLILLLRIVYVTLKGIIVFILNIIRELKKVNNADSNLSLK